MLKKSTLRAVILAFTQLCEEKEFDAITVKELCELSEISKPTFYKYFRDKYDAIASIYLFDAGLWGSEDIYYSLEKTKAALSNIQSHRLIYLKAFASKGQNSLYDFVAEHAINGHIKQFEKSFERKMTNEELYIVGCYTYGWIHGIITWLSGKTNYTTDELAAYQVRNVPAFLKESFN